ncbi:MAG: hypothetical protein ACTSPQ_13750 [Candidatus Helarchaeota archaeon]
MKYIELTGIPGSGKSTILRLIEKYFRKKGYKVYNKDNIIQCSDAYLFKNRYFKNLFSLLPNKFKDPILIKLIDHTFIRHKYELKFLLNNIQIFDYIINLNNNRPISENHINLVIKWFISTAGRYEIWKVNNNNNNSILVLDEGFVHKIVSLFVSIEEETINFQEIEKYLNMIPKIDLLIKIEANEHLCMNRIITRKLPVRLEGKSENEIIEFLSRAKIAIDYGTNFLVKNGIKLITLNNSNEGFNKDYLISQLTKKLKKIKFP